MSKIYVCTASWEPRFLLAIRDQLKRDQYDKAIIWYSSRSETMTQEARDDAKLMFETVNCSATFVKLNFDDQLDCYSNIRRELSEELLPGVSFVFDVSTSPRDIALFNAIYLLEKTDAAYLCYYPGEVYGEWLSREAREPRMVLGASGIMYPELPTCVIFLGSNLYAKMEQVQYYFEPSKVVLLLDTNRGAYGSESELTYSMESTIDRSDFDQKDVSSENCERFLSILENYVSDFNIVIVSQGPKIGIVHLLRALKKFEGVGIAYVPSNVYNSRYSDGISEPVFAPLNF